MVAHLKEINGIPAQRHWVRVIGRAGPCRAKRRNFSFISGMLGESFAVVVDFSLTLQWFNLSFSNCWHLRCENIQQKQPLHLFKFCVSFIWALRNELLIAIWRHRVRIFFTKNKILCYSKYLNKPCHLNTFLVHGTLALVLDGWTMSVTYLQWPKKPTLIVNPILPLIQHSILIKINRKVSIVPNKKNTEKSMDLNVLDLYDTPLCIHSARLHPPSKGVNRHYNEKNSTTL